MSVESTWTLFVLRLMQSQFSRNRRDKEWIIVDAKFKESKG